MNKKVLVLAPHPDDELLLAGALIYTLKKKKYDITVAYLTNGDSSANHGETRMREAIEALHVLGVKESNIIFMGYGNNWKDGTHLYNIYNNEIATSCADKKETYGLKNHPEYCMQKLGIHHQYTRSNVLEDIESIITDISADTIICVDFDAHSDHRALSLFFEEAMRDILRRDKDYKPIVLKKFAYAGISSGKWDYYHKPMLETQPGYYNERLDLRYECDNPIYRWSDRVQLKVDRKTRTRYISNNILYKAALKHKSQKFHLRVGVFANADVVYWQRRTDSISYRANVSATSGNAAYVNDFKLIDCSNILSAADESVQILDNCVWNPELTDTNPKLFFDFEQPVNISKIYIYENFLPGENIVKAQLVFDTGKTIDINQIDHQGRKTEVVFETQYDVKHLEFHIVEHEGSKYGLTELEIYEQDNEQLIPLEKYQKPDKKSKNIENDFDILLERKVHNIVINNTKQGFYYEMYQILLNWSFVGSNQIVKWLKNKNYKKVAIYGMGDMGRKLHRDLEQSKIEVSYTMDQYAGSMTATVPLVTASQFKVMPEVDIVIVTVVQSFDVVKRELISKGCDEGKIISLKDVINEVKYENND